MSNLFWQPPKLWTLADCLLVVTEATSSAATGISTLLSASWGWAQSISSCTMFLCGAEGLKNTVPQTPTSALVGNTPIHTSLGNELGYFSSLLWGSEHSDRSIQQGGGRLCPGLLHSCR